MNPDSIKDNGGPAFPTKYRDSAIAPPAEGMTLRDYFAAKAMQAYISAYPCQAVDAEDGGKHLDFWAVAGDAYQVADAMLKQREEA